ncbi:MAG TPA: YbhB/YbcL family Raf kinase inhibitor-like protein [Rhizomicrobium sp.]|nr:YbhB/YbcL family Raf kinase inhibitor-like protein [Rhizomicrobium sp.]
MKWLVALIALSVPASAMEMTSHDMADGAMLSTQQVHGDCNGDNISPALAWSGAPAGTKSFALTVYDPDASGGWWHWIVFDIPPGTRGLAQGAGANPSQLPAGSIEGQNDFQRSAYGGACPPPGSGIHHYRFTLWALDTASLPFDTGSGGGDIAPFLKKHALATATLTPVYRR